MGGLALRGIGNQVWARLCGEPGIKLRVEGTNSLSSDPKINVVGMVASYVMDKLRARELESGGEPGLELLLKSEIPVGSGLGSSAASSVAGAMAVNVLLGDSLSRRELLHTARLGEKFTSGSGHADNVAPSLMGGVTLAPCYEPDDFEQEVEPVALPLPSDLMRRLHLAIVRPCIQVNTMQAREILKDVNEPIREIVRYTGAMAAELACDRSPRCDRYKKIKSDASERLSQACGGKEADSVEKYLHGTERLVRAFIAGDIKEVGKAVEQDAIITSKRARFISDSSGCDLYGPLVKAARDGGAYGCSICGSGPSIFAVTDSREKAFKISDIMSETLKRKGTEHQSFVSTINDKGAHVLK